MGVSAEVIVRELFDRLELGDESAVDDLMAPDLVNHAAGPHRQGRDGWRMILDVIDHDLGPVPPSGVHLAAQSRPVERREPRHPRPLECWLRRG
jgi:lactoylglutathione lyase